jgi:hypothetical protein
MNYTVKLIKQTKYLESTLLDFKILKYRLQVKILKLYSDLPNHKEPEGINYKFYYTLSGLLIFLSKKYIRKGNNWVLLRTDNTYHKVKVIKESKVLSINYIKYEK